MCAAKGCARVSSKLGKNIWEMCTLEVIVGGKIKMGPVFRPHAVIVNNLETLKNAPIRKPDNGKSILNSK